MDERVAALTDAFARYWGGAPTFIVRAPGRVNLIGDHTDYNDGFVLPMAIDRAAWIALRPRSDRVVWLTSLDFHETAELHLDDLHNEQAGWSEYVKGVAWALQARGYLLHGWEGVLIGDVPIGAGLSSSAALEIAAARAFQLVGGWAWDAAAMALAAQAAENQWVGMNCGIMDQLISAAGVAGHALLIDCRSLAVQPVPLPPDTAVVVLDTATRRGLVDSAYNARRSQCEAAARSFGVSHLRDVDLPTLMARADALDPVVLRRARHVVGENARVLAAVRAMQAGDAVTLGALMDAGHASLRDDFEVSSPALDAMVAQARRHVGCYGARLTGAGFGGCAVALVGATAVRSFVAEVSAAYTAETGHIPAVYVCRPMAGAEGRRLDG